MKKFFSLLFVLLIGAFAIGLIQKNPQVVPISYYGNLEWTGPLFVIILVTLFIGMFIGYLASYPKRFGLFRKLKQKEKEIKKMQNALLEYESRVASPSE